MGTSVLRKRYYLYVSSKVANRFMLEIAISIKGGLNVTDVFVLIRDVYTNIYRNLYKNSLIINAKNR